MWAAGLVTRFSKRPNGKTPYEEVRGKQSDTPLAVFGEKVLYMPKIESKQQNKFASGIFLGLERRSNESIIGTEGGVYKARTVRRLKPDAQWDAESINKINGTPYEPVPGRPGEGITMGTEQDGAVAPREPGNAEGEVVDLPSNEPKEPQTTRKMYIRKADVERYGPTDGCNGCRGVLTGEKWPGGKTIPHSSKCRAHPGPH